MLSTLLLTQATECRNRRGQLRKDPGAEHTCLHTHAHAHIHVLISHKHNSKKRAYRPLQCSKELHGWVIYKRIASYSWAGLPTAVTLHLGRGGSALFSSPPPWCHLAQAEAPVAVPLLQANSRMSPLSRAHGLKFRTQHWTPCVRGRRVGLHAVSQRHVMF